MSDTDDFMQEFLRAEREMHRYYSELEYKMWARFAAPGLSPYNPVESQAKWDAHTGFESSDGLDLSRKATFIATVIRPIHWVTRARFTLRQIDGAWRIDGLGYFCKICNGSGSSPKGVICTICHGKGYFASIELINGEVSAKSKDSRSKSIQPSTQDIDGFMHEFILAQRALFRQIAEIEQALWSRFALPHLHCNHYAKAHAAWDDSAMVETFNEDGELASVKATVVRVFRSLTRVRHTMVKSDSSWRLDDLAYECHLCNGKGLTLTDRGSGINDQACPLCHGEGWLNPEKRQQA